MGGGAQFTRRDGIIQQDICSRPGLAVLFVTSVLASALRHQHAILIFIRTKVHTLVVIAQDCTKRIV